MLYIHETCRQHLKVGLKQQSACQLCPMLLWELESLNAMIMRWKDWSDAAGAWLGVIMTPSRWLIMEELCGENLTCEQLSRVWTICRMSLLLPQLKMRSGVNKKNQDCRYDNRAKYHLTVPWWSTQIFTVIVSNFCFWWVKSTAWWLLVSSFIKVDLQWQESLIVHVDWNAEDTTMTVLDHSWCIQIAVGWDGTETNYKWLLGERRECDDIHVPRCIWCSHVRSQQRV